MLRRCHRPVMGMLVCGVMAARAGTPVRISWQQAPAYPMGIQDSAFGVLDGKIISAGGFTRHPKDIVSKWADAFGGAKSGFTSLVFLFDPRHPDRGWSRIADVPGPPRQAAAAAVVGHSLYAIGGFSYTAPYSYRATYRLLQENGRWVWTNVHADLPWPLCEAAVAVIGSRLYLVTGADFYPAPGDKDPDFNAVQGRHGEPVGRALLVLDTARPQQGWRRLADLPGTARFDAAVGAAGGKIYVLSGVNRIGQHAKGYCNVVDTGVYDPASNQWTRMPDLPHNSNQRAASYANRYLILMGAYRYGVTCNPDGTTSETYTAAEKQRDWKAFFQPAVMVYDTRTGQVDATDPLPDKTSFPMAAADDGTLYVLGGEGGSHLWHPDTFFIGHIRSGPNERH